MKRPKKISAIMHKLLVEEKMDGFSAIEARNALLSFGWQGSSSDELRKQLYRQLLQFNDKGWLKSEGIGRNKRFYVTSAFRGLCVASKSVQQEKTAVNHSVRPQDYSVLVIEQRQYEGELKIVLGEIDEYRSLLVRFPCLEEHILPLQKLSKVRSAELLGKVNVLSNVLKSLSQGGLNVKAMAV